jgi:hypothetical protein
MNFFASLVGRQQTSTRTPSGTGPTLIDPKDFRHVGGGSPRGTWDKSPTTTTTTQSPRGTW